MSCWVCWPRWPVCDLREERGEITADVELVAAPLDRTRMRGGDDILPPGLYCAGQSQWELRAESSGLNLKVWKTPWWQHAGRTEVQLGWDRTRLGNIFQNIFTVFIFSTLSLSAFVFATLGRKNIFYIFADSRISFRELVFIEPHSAGSALGILRLTKEDCYCPVLSSAS